MNLNSLHIILIYPIRDRDYLIISILILSSYPAILHYLLNRGSVLFLLQN